ncbi:transcriptional regulator with XRE-family HTH domain [Kitasatospora sp. MAA19]|uniref:helix-turn-helix domain-containing protein n=1 Tax=Kitasatospora sp. MAA19 TaxID=3035090 RepID=UPI002476B789|nr:helix-turn-helix transcriptional regulator [Kitasatospora sp. MAA19]MDH6709804.1 transcriptional regulator with XRE-family HTH domain [Kitasatospora sp. MAA19]
MSSTTYRFDTERLMEAAARMGDNSGYAIARRTGLTQSAVSRILAGRRQPTLTSAALMARTYSTPLDDLVGVAA